jgi:holo-[acyl-carrier protein] synthase
MQIIGTGLDATEIPRISEVITRFGSRFLARIFTEGEIAYCQAHRRAAQHFAARFAVKEAAMKALGTGHSQGVLWRDVEVVRHGGPPQLQLHGAAARRFAAIGGRSSVVTITHTDTLAMAHVIMMGER